MKKIYMDRIKVRSQQLKNNPLCRNFLDPEMQKMGIFMFAPHMTYFVLGFRDILDELRYENPKTEEEKSINQHCDEDSHHWLWFIEDLQKLDVNQNYWGPDSSSVLKKIWSRNDFPIREFVHRIIHYIRSHQEANERLVIVECLEEAFKVFINSLNSVTSGLDLQNHLRYFGSDHFEEEHNHTINASDNVINAEEDFTDELMMIQQRELLLLINDIFDGFDSMFSHWNSVIDKTNIASSAQSENQQNRVASQ